jgi:hypothetical protein
MDKARAAARAAKAQEQTATDVIALREQLDRIEAKLDALLSETQGKPKDKPAKNTKEGGE